MRKKINIKKIAAGIAGIAIFIVFLKWVNFFQNMELLRNLDVAYIAVAVMIMILSITLRGTRFYILARGTGNETGLKESLSATYMSMVMSAITPGRIGEAGKMFWMKDRKRLLSPVILEKIFDLVMLLIAALVAVLFLKKYYIAYAIAFVLCVAIILLISRIHVFINILMKKSIFGKDQFFKDLKRIGNLSYLTAILFTTCIFFMGIAAQYTVALSMGIEISFWLLTGISALAVIAALLSGIPSGIGITQVTYTFMIVRETSISVETAGMFNVLMLFITYSVYLSVSGIGFGMYKLSNHTGH